MLTTENKRETDQEKDERFNSLTDADAEFRLELVKKHLHRATVPPPSENGAGQAKQPVLALFCFADSASEMGAGVEKLAANLTQGGFAVHVFARTGFEALAKKAVVHLVGESPEGDLIDQVQEFSRRACNVFMQKFPNGSPPVTLMGCEWSAIPALSLLQGIKNHPVLLFLHSLERQRSDMTWEVSHKIEEIEISGLRAAKTILVKDEAAAGVARQLLPDCAQRLVMAPEVFSLSPFQTVQDPGSIKARYQVGPVDPTILFVGDLSETYGPDLALKAMPAVLKNHPQARLIIVGEGSLLWPLRVYNRYLLLEHAVRLAGNVQGQALEELIQAADIVVVPSRKSTPWWPIKAAWAAGRPVVATHDAAPGLVAHEQDGVLVYASENSLVWGIERILYDAGLRQTLAWNGREKLEKHFGWTAVAGQMEKLLGVPAQ